jgi:hypothetical protein
MAPSMYISGYQIMPSRYRGMSEALEGYQMSGVPLVAWHDGRFARTYLSDDIGIHYLVPLVASLLHLSLDKAILVFFLGILGISLTLGIVGCFLWLKNPISRTVAVIALIIATRSAFLAGDVYIIYATLVISIIPFLMWFLKKDVFGYGFFIYLFAAGFMAGIAHYIRTFSEMTLIILLVCLIVSTRQLSWKLKTLSIGMMIVGQIIPAIFFNALIYNRDAWLAANQPGPQQAHVGHSLWHSTYLGLGYLPNDLGISYSDPIALGKARSVDPDVQYPSLRYNQILKDEIFRIIVTDPWFVVKTVLAKVGVVLLLLLEYANIGLIAAFLRRKPWAIELSFIAAMIAGSVPGIVAIPRTSYLMAFMATCVIYAIASIDWTLESWKKK